MFVKIDTKAHFILFRVQVPSVHANMAEELGDLLEKRMRKPPGNIILAMDGVTDMELPILELLSGMEDRSRAQNRSFVVTGLQASVKKKLQNSALFNRLKALRTLEEGIDYVMMEELEREFQDQDEDP